MAACINNYTQPVALRVSTVSVAIDFLCLRLVTVSLLFLMFNSHLFFFKQNMCLCICVFIRYQDFIYSSVFTRFIEWLYYSVRKRLFDYFDVNHQGCVQKCCLQFTNDQLRYHMYDISIRIS